MEIRINSGCAKLRKLQIIGQESEIIETVAAEEHRTTQMVEKDTIQSMILFGRYVQFYQSYPEIVGIMTSQSDDLE